ncbi:MAG TPA: hypothetical protein VLH75_16380 [Longimicrobiales bacterium]|nr:hypothetical protein [Longimicrobiales bacterium]
MRHALIAAAGIFGAGVVGAPAGAQNQDEVLRAHRLPGSGWTGS